MRARILAYTKSFREVHIVVLCGPGYTPEVVEGRVHLHPTNSRLRFLRVFDALRIGKKVSAIDVVTSQDPFETGVAAWLIARKKRAPLHVQVHTDFLSREYWNLSLLNRIRVFLAGFVLMRAARIRAVSDRIAHSIEEKFSLEVPITTLPIFVDTARFSEARPDEALKKRFERFSFRFLVVSRLEREKNVALALRAFAASAPQESCLIIVGDGTELVMLKGAAKQLRIDERVFFEGTRDPAPYYALADLVLLPSRYEGYGLVIVEALAAGKPVLATNVGVAREAGAIVASEDGFAEALAAWVSEGPRTAILQDYPYRNFEEYVRAYCDDIEKSVEVRG